MNEVENRWEIPITWSNLRTKLCITETRGFFPSCRSPPALVALNVVIVNAREGEDRAAHSGTCLHDDPRDSGSSTLGFC